MEEEEEDKKEREKEKEEERRMIMRKKYERDWLEDEEKREVRGGSVINWYGRAGYAEGDEQ